MYKIFWLLTVVITIMEFVDCCKALYEEEQELINYHFRKFTLGMFMTAGWIFCWMKGVI